MEKDVARGAAFTADEESPHQLLAVEEGRATEAPSVQQSAVDQGRGTVGSGPALSDVTLSFLPPSSDSLRAECMQVVSHTAYESLMTVAVVASSLMLTLETPRLDPNSGLALTLRLTNYAFTCLFLVEAILKTCALGFAFTPRAYLNDGWNRLDFFVLLVSVAAIASEMLPHLEPLRPLRALRILRPLRLFSRNAGIKLILSSLYEAMPAVFDVVGVIFFVQLAFAIVGMQLFSGTFGACTDSAVLDPSECVLVHPQLAANLTERLALPRQLQADNEDSPASLSPSAGAQRSLRQWKNPYFGSFDDFGQAMLLLLVCATGDDWDQVMFWAMDSALPGEPRRRNDSSARCIFFVGWVFVGTFFCVQLFVGVIVAQFNAIRARKDGSATMTDGQKQWIETQMVAKLHRKAKANPRRPIGWCDEMFVGLVNSYAASVLTTSMVVLNVIALAANAHTEDVHGMHAQLLEFGNYFFYAEAMIKVTAFGLIFYADDEWCRFEGGLVVLALFSQSRILPYLSETWHPLPGLLTRAPDSALALRALRLVQHASGFQSLMKTIMLSLSSFVNVGLLLSLIVFIYAVLGVELFAFVDRGIYFTDLRNFDFFSNAVMLIFQCLTGDGWSSLMYEALRDEVHGSTLAIPYFVSFQLLGSYVILNLVVAVILENFTSLGNGNNDLVGGRDVEIFQEKWSEFECALRRARGVLGGAVRARAVPILEFLGGRERVHRLPPPLHPDPSPFPAFRAACALRTPRQLLTCRACPCREQSGRDRPFAAGDAAQSDMCATAAAWITRGTAQLGRAGLPQPRDAELQWEAQARRRTQHAGSVQLSAANDR